MSKRAACIGILILGIVPASMVLAQQIATDGPVQAVMIARTPQGQQGAMPLIDEQIRVTIDSQHATTKLKQVYRNQARSAVEGRYRLVAGSGSRVDGFAYWNGEQKIVGEVFEKQVARAIYDNVTRRRRDPGLLEQVGDGLFSFKIFPIQPNEEKRVEVSYTNWLSRRGKMIEYRAPVNRPDANIVVTIQSQYKVTGIRSPSHAIDVDDLRAGGARIRVNRARGQQKEFVLRYRIAHDPWTATAFVHRDQGHDGYFALALPAPVLPETSVAAKDVTIVLDRSGSMMGEPLEQARIAAANVVRRLGAGDRVNVVAFDDDVDPLFELPQIASEDNRRRAIQFIERLTDGGGTDLALALETAFNAQAQDPRPRVILFLTDGQSNVQNAIDAVKADRRDARVFTVGLGNGVNKPLLSRVAAIKRGRFMHIRNAREIERDVATLYRRISKPLLVDVALDVSGAMALRTYPRSIPDLFMDDELLITGRLRGNGPVSFTVRGILDGKPLSRTVRMTLRGTHDRRWVGKLWAQSRVDHLLEEIALSGENKELEDEVIELALAYNFVTRYTSFLAIPESEITGAAQDMMRSARERKGRIMAKHADATSLQEKSKGKKQVATGSSMRVQTTRAPRAPMSANAPPPPPQPSPAMPRQFRTEVDSADASTSDDDASYADEDTSNGAPGTEALAVKSKGGGCAGCATSGSRGDAGAMFLALMVAAVLLRRRRGMS